MTVNDITLDGRRIGIEIKQDGDSLLSDGDTLTAYSNPFFSGDVVHVEIENPWAGDSETGFGLSASVNLTREEAAVLGEFLTRWAAAKPC